MVPVEIIMTDNKQAGDSDHRGVDGLTEVLRLQAEALSRISERMAGMHGNQTEPTPVSTPPPVKPGAGRASESLPVLARDPVLSEESLPVLNSFKNFLDQERRRGRKRMLWVLFGFTVAFSIVLAIIVWMNLERSRELKADIIQTGARTERVRADADAELKRLSEKAAATATQNVSQMRKDITRNILWAHSVISSNVSSELSGRDSEMERLKDKIATIEVENAMLSRQVTEFGKRLSALEDDARLNNMERENQFQDVVAATNKRSVAAKETPVTINSAKYGRSFQLRMPQE